MYSEADFEAIRRRIARQRAALLTALALLAALIVLSLVRRWRVAAMASGALLAASLVFGVGFYLLPCRRYLRFLEDMRQGLSREMTGTVAEISESEDLQDGARVLPVRLRLADGEDERIVYLNASKRALFPAEGARVRLRLCGRHIREVETI